MIIKLRKAQNTLEYAVLIFFVVMGLIAMQTWLKRSYQGKLKESSESLGEPFGAGSTEYNYTVTRNSQTTETVRNGVTRSELTAPEVTTKTGTESVGAIDDEVWHNN